MLLQKRGEGTWKNNKLWQTSQVIKRWKDDPILRNHNYLHNCLHLIKLGCQAPVSFLGQETTLAPIDRSPIRLLRLWDSPSKYWEAAISLSNAWKWVPGAVEVTLEADVHPRSNPTDLHSPSCPWGFPQARVLWSGHWLPSQKNWLDDTAYCLHKLEMAPLKITITLKVWYASIVCHEYKNYVYSAII